MCEYCDLYTKHLNTIKKAARVFEADGIPCNDAVVIWAYSAGLAVGAEAKNVYAATSAVNAAYNAGLSKGYTLRDKDEQTPEGEVRH